MRRGGKASMISNLALAFCWSIFVWRCCKHGCEKVNLSSQENSHVSSSLFNSVVKVWLARDELDAFATTTTTSINNNNNNIITSTNITSSSNKKKVRIPPPNNPPAPPPPLSNSRVLGESWLGGGEGWNQSKRTPPPSTAAPAAPRCEVRVGWEGERAGTKAKKHHHHQRQHQQHQDARWELVGRGRGLEPKQKNTTTINGSTSSTKMRGESWLGGGEGWNQSKKTPPPSTAALAAPRCEVRVGWEGERAGTKAKKHHHHQRQHQQHQDARWELVGRGRGLEPKQKKHHHHQQQHQQHQDARWEQANLQTSVLLPTGVKGDEHRHHVRKQAGVVVPVPRNTHNTFG